MAEVQARDQSTIAAATNSMRKFSLKPRKSSRSSSKNGGSSATNESVSNSSRPSLAESARHRSNLASFSSRLLKGRKNTSERIQENGQEESQTLGQRFCELPAEIQTSILAYLDIAELLSLRRVSKQCLAIFQANSSTIARNALIAKGSNNDHSPYFLVDLFPPLFASATSDAYLLRCLRRERQIQRQLHVLLTFIQTRVYMLRLARDLQCEQFSPYRIGLHARLYHPVGLTQHFLETVRHLITHSHPGHLSPRLTLNECPVCMSTLGQTINSYPKHLLLPMYQTIQLLIQHFRTATRTPSLVTPFERKLRGWGYGPPPEEHMSQLVLLGCLGELCKIDEMRGSYPKRLSIVKQFCDKMSEAVKYNSDPISDFYQTQTDPVMAMAGLPAKGKKVAPASKALRKDMEDVRLALEARADETSWGGVTKSLDVRLDLLTEGMMKSVPGLDKFLVGPNTLLGKRIMELQLVEHERELLSPYGFVQRLMAESYEPDIGEHDAEQSTDVNAL